MRTITGGLVVIAGAIMASTGAVLAQIHGHDTSEAMEWIGAIAIVIGLAMAFIPSAKEPPRL